MLQYLVAQVRRPIDNAIAGIVGKLVVGLPLVVAFIFLVSALNNYLHTIWGPVRANLALAGIFFAVAAVAAIAVASKNAGDQQASRTPAIKTPDGTPDHAAATTETPSGPVQSVVQGIANLSPQERDLAMSVAATAVPVILPRLLKLSARNIKIIGVAAAAFYFIGRLRKRAPADDVGKDAVGK